MKGLYISAIKKSSGKTTLSIAITRLLSDEGYSVATFKKGPDYIDPMWLTLASKRQCFNIDFFFHKKNIKDYFFENANGADFAIIESNHGLFDDIGVCGRKSNAELAKLLGLPILLVIDVSEFGRSIIPIILGILSFDKNIKITGIILNRVQNKRHENKLTSALRKYLNIPIVGVIPVNNEIKIEQRHLGLSSNLEKNEMNGKIDILSSIIKKYIDLNKIKNCATLIDNKSFDILNTDDKLEINGRLKNKKVGICLDKAFNFYYPNNLDIIKKFSKKLYYISPLIDEKLPDIDFLYIGGGFPELFAKILEKNEIFKAHLKKLIENGLYVYAECGGLIYLTEEMIFRNNSYKMLGVIKSKSVFQEKPVAHGYTILKKNNDSRGNVVQLPLVLRGHEFHHFYLEELQHYDFAYKVLRGKGIKDGFDGILYKNVLANFSHIYDNESSGLFISFVNR
jgi:cobyrinic acid a,c-diamide synthase